MISIKKYVLYDSFCFKIGMEILGNWSLVMLIYNVYICSYSYIRVKSIERGRICKLIVY